MKRKYLIAGTITLLVSVAVFIVWVTLPNLDFFNSISVSKHDVDVSKDIILEFKDANVSLNEWGKNYVEVTYDNVLGGKVNLDISATGNTLTLNSDLDFSGYKHLDIKVPKAVIRINANLIQAKSGTFRATKANKTTLRYCSMADGFVSEGGELEIREGKFIGNSILKNKVVNIRECDINDVVLSSDNPEKRINAYLRELSGKSVKLDAEVCDDLCVELKDPALDKFVVNYTGDSGKITVFSGSIKKIENNSKIKIYFKEHFYQESP